jgi:hypothetical protein
MNTPYVFHVWPIKKGYNLALFEKGLTSFSKNRRSDSQRTNQHFREEVAKKIKKPG